MRIVTLLCAAFFISAPIATADVTDGWSGEGSFSAGTTSGNTDTTDLGLGLDLTRKVGDWAVGVNAAADFGETDGVETKNRTFLAGNVDRDINEKLFVFGQTSFEKDEFSGFENRVFLGAGAGYRVYDNEQLSWELRAAPGYKLDEIREVLSGSVVTTPGETVESFAVLGASEFNWQLNDNVSISNSTDAIYAEESTQLGNTLALTASLTSTLSARVSFDVRHDTSPPEGFESTDTATRISLVYKFGA